MSLSWRWRCAGHRPAERNENEREDEHPRHQPENIVERERQRLLSHYRAEELACEKGGVLRIGAYSGEPLRQLSNCVSSYACVVTE